jgi:RNA polymerase sigma-54 factor
MVVSARLGLRQSQTLALTPQLKQAIKLLQLSSLELSAYVAEALDQNPLLERDAPIDAGRRPDSGDAIDRAPAPEASLADHLRGQLAFAALGAGERAIGARLIEALDEAGYLIDDPASLAAPLGCEVADIEAVLVTLRRFDPPGVFARDLAECWALQLRDRDRLDPAMQALLDNLELWERRDFERLKRICGVDAEDLADMVAEIKALNPWPASAFDHEVIQSITPEVIMRPLPDGGWRLELNPDALPRVLVNRRYHAEVSRNARTPADKAYMAERLQSANWLVKSLHQRANTILKVATEIVRQQEAFFIHGVQHLRPLVLRDIAAAIEMHESTVSRVTSNKFMATPRGIYELKYFFTAAIASSSGGAAHSAEAVRHRIKVLIHAEPPDQVLSDARIVGVLRADGIDIARRTVQKYRESMRIPKSVQRRREKAAGL